MSNEAGKKAELIRREITSHERETARRKRGDTRPLTGEDEARRETPPSLDVERIVGPLMLEQRQAAGGGSRRQIIRGDETQVGHVAGVRARSDQAE